MLPIKKIHFKYKDITKLKVKEWKKVYRANTNQKKASIVVILLSDNVDFRSKNITINRDILY